MYGKINFNAILGTFCWVLQKYRENIQKYKLQMNLNTAELEFVVQSSKRYMKSENWFSEMQSKLEEEIVRNVKKKKNQVLTRMKSSYDVLNVWLWIWENEVQSCCC